MSDTSKKSDIEKYVKWVKQQLGMLVPLHLIRQFGVHSPCHAHLWGFNHDKQLYFCRICKQKPSEVSDIFFGYKEEKKNGNRSNKKS